MLAPVPAEAKAGEGHVFGSATGISVSGFRGFRGLRGLRGSRV